MKLEASQLIAEGRTAEVYAWGDGQVLKLYQTWCPPQWIGNEARVARALVAAGIPTPAAGEIIDIEGRRGLVYERIYGRSLLAEMNARPWRLLQNAHTLAELQAQVHSLQLAELPSYKQSLASCIQRAAHLPADLREKALARLEALPEGESVCHADFHPGNVLLTTHGPIIIDWMTAARGNPWADVARTSLILQIGARAAGKMINPFIRGAISLYYRAYLKRYRSLRPDPENLLSRWLPVIAAARLDENIEPERQALLQLIQEAE